MYGLQIFPPTRRVAFHLVVSLALQKLFSLMWSPLPIFVLAPSVFGVKSKKPLLRQSLAFVGLRFLSRTLRGSMPDTSERRLGCGNRKTPNTQGLQQDGYVFTAQRAFPGRQWVGSVLLG